ncbi:ATP-binding protein [Arcobacter roscoffensis]|uniref:histidine kinase n=1 Tax=Arcobacter roscoffensis TaxID=2961520 RepID=A0ABY5E326_9BACT|nr:ATP-binding protein [Arcobacter roscoffensis]UTJ06277.1 ATP-binding protein [Arcobacter roscoffensis]
MKKSSYKIFTIIIYFIVSVLAFSITTNYILEKENKLLHKKYNAISSNLNDKINSLIQKKKNATLAFTITLANNAEVSEVLNSKEYSKDSLNKLSLLLRKETDFKNVWFQVINKNGISLYRSWSKKKGDDLSKVRSDLKNMIKTPKIKSTISVGKYDMTFKAMVPIYKDGKFEGVIESITHFNSISRSLRKSDLFEPIIVVDKKYTKQLEKNAFTKIFVDDYYIANLSANKKVLEYLDTNNIENFLKIKDYKVKDEYLIVNTPIFYDDNKLGNFLSFKKLNQIDIQYIEEYKHNAFLYLIFFILLLGLVLYSASHYLYSKELKKLYIRLNENQDKLHNLNSSLQKTVEEEVTKNYEKNKILFQQSKMAAMGEMIGNIAHQWRQPLSVITTAATGIKMKKEIGILSDNEYNDSLNMIVKSANYLSNTIDDFRNFFSPTKDKNTVNAKEFIDKVFSLVKSNYQNKDIEVITQIEDFEIHIFENELLQVMINLLNNSRDELIRKKSNTQRFIFLDLYAKNESLIISIKDSADGVDESIIDRIFEPYFTTKHQSQGTGIGLFMCEEIICKHMHGKIEVFNDEFMYKNQEYKGARFKVSIPLK